MHQCITICYLCQRKFSCENTYRSSTHEGKNMHFFFKLIHTIYPFSLNAWFVDVYFEGRKYKMFYILQPFQFETSLNGIQSKWWQENQKRHNIPLPIYYNISWGFFLSPRAIFYVSIHCSSYIIRVWSKK
jgi:hypothetical protein